MPYYDYLCPKCGPFTVLRPMAEFAAPYPCAGCGVAAPRALLTAPAMSGLDPARRAAIATNERSASVPTRHARPATPPPKASPSPRRPWMLGH